MFEQSEIVNQPFKIDKNEHSCSGDSSINEAPFEKLNKIEQIQSKLSKYIIPENQRKGKRKQVLKNLQILKQ